VFAQIKAVTEAFSYVSVAYRYAALTDDSDRIIGQSVVAKEEQDGTASPRWTGRCRSARLKDWTFEAVELPNKGVELAAAGNQSLPCQGAVRAFVVFSPVRAYQDANWVARDKHTTGGGIQAGCELAVVRLA